MAPEANAEANSDVQAIYILRSLANIQASPATSASAFFASSLIPQSSETKTLKGLISLLLGSTITLRNLSDLPALSPSDLPPQTCIPNPLSSFKSRATMGTGTDRSHNDDSIEAILRLPPDQWAEAGTKVVEREKKARGKTNSDKLAEKLFDAFDALSTKQAEIAAILRKQAIIDPESASTEFRLFRVLQTAKYFKKSVSIYTLPYVS